MTDLSDVAVVLLVFNRPEHTRRMWESVQAVRPRRLLIVADGPRSDDERKLCEQARDVVRFPDWDCDVETCFAERNLGCHRRVSSGLTWAFERCERAVVLEDDCVAEPTFFRYCGELLDRYADDQRVMAISGDNFQGGHQRGTGSYYFSCHPHCWGWASWSRAWQFYDDEMGSWPARRESGWLQDILGRASESAYWTKIFDEVYHGRINSWAYRWCFSCWVQQGLTALPNTNLVSNVGFDAGATHTQNPHPAAELRTSPLEFPLRHPSAVARDVSADRYTFRHHFQPRPGLLQRLRSRAARTLRAVR